SCSVIVVSDSRTEQNDESGKYIMQILKKHSHEVLSYALLKNDADAILNRVNELLDEEKLQVIITSGGTGISCRDVTVETISPILGKNIDGFGELFRFLTYQQIHTGSIMSRATAGVTRDKVIICLPGSLGAVSLAMEKIILPEIGHMVREAQR
ncbi:MAG: MogA/MoaB family molybdenum cofactor biosynthesis protein, partial [Dehalococcoidales bacterium]|nr:MogA/MoaB family molybdenum cofactor biosynthesis protein [Dehalococcoidales bacterium]